MKVLAQASGVRGMCLGQSLDLISEHKQVNLDELELIHRNKTGALLTAALNWVLSALLTLKTKN